jgi:hypothetical protein
LWKSRYQPSPGYRELFGTRGRLGAGARLLVEPLQRLETTRVYAQRPAAGQEVGIYYEIFKAGARQRLFQARARAGRACRPGLGRVAPFVARSVGALRQPYAGGGPGEVAAVDRGRGAELQRDGFVPAEEREVRVRRGAGN